jgi:hypothetical protein
LVAINNNCEVRTGTVTGGRSMAKVYNAKKSTWIIPHVIKFREDSEIINWCCKWGNNYESSCLYAMNKSKKVDDAPIPDLE